MEKLNDMQDALLRAILIEQVKQTSGYSKNLEKFIIRKMTQEQIVLLVFRKHIVNEAFLSTDIEREMFIKKMTPFLQWVSAAGFLFFFGGRISDRVKDFIQKTGFSLFDPKKDLKGAEHKSGMVAGGTAGIISHGVGIIISKILQIMLIKSFLVCNRNCERGIPGNTISRESSVKICVQKCRISGIEKVLRKLQSDAMMCDTTKNAWKCKSTLYSKIGELQERYQSEKKQLDKLIEFSKKQPPHFAKPPPYAVANVNKQTPKKD